ncbi:Fe-Mn family superoxide dismutase [Rheinheimera sp.]|uniref:Fe-Mn family superoxide dismutase n=1 Tax=Rheinheimera sp. TaxID=1869214 RepID=UPI00307F6D2D
MAFELPALPYAKDALLPHISPETLDYHHGKHHNAYVVKLNSLIEGTEYAGKSLEEIIVASKQGPVFNNAAQIWNHTFYWHCLSPQGGGEATGALGDAIKAKWGSFAAFQTEFNDRAVNNFGSSWTWLVKKADGSLDIVNTSNAGTPITEAGVTPVLTVDLWEHAYYIDFRNARPTYLNAFWALVNWEFAAANFAK